VSSADQRTGTSNRVRQLYQVFTTSVNLLYYLLRIYYVLLALVLVLVSILISWISFSDAFIIKVSKNRPDRK